MVCLMRLLRGVVLSVCCAVVFSIQAGDAAPTSYQKHAIEGWTVHVNDSLLRDEKAATETMLELLAAQLKEIIRTVPAGAVAHLKKVPLWINPAYPGIPPRAEYHPSIGWLKAQKRNPEMAKCVEFTDVKNFEAETKRMPAVVLHELAHAFHDQVYGFDHVEILAAYKKAVASMSYDKVQRWHGVSGRTSTERAYAMSSPQEYFAECTEAYFVRNDFFPFTRDEFEKHDPEFYSLLEQLWTLAVPGKTK
jgi:hypothetical protein